MGIGGAERSTAELWYHLRSEGLDFAVVALRNEPNGLQKEVLDSGVKVIFLPSENFFVGLFFLIRLIRREKPTIVHSVLFKSNLRARFAKLFCPFFFHLESLVSERYSRERTADKNVNRVALIIYKLMDRLTSKFLVHEFVSVTESVKQHYIENLSIKPKKIRTIYRGRKPNMFIEQRNILKDKLMTDLRIKPGSVLMIALGRQDFPKGYIYLLEAVAMLVKSRPNIRLLLAGRDGTSTPELWRFVRDHHLQDSVSFLGNRTDVYELLAASDIFVSSSVYEGLSGAVIEALASGLPIISSDLAGLREVMTEENALFVPPKSGKAIAGAVEYLLNNSQRLSEMGEKNLALFKRSFLVEKMNHAFVNLYRSMATR